MKTHRPSLTLLVLFQFHLLINLAASASNLNLTSPSLLTLPDPLHALPSDPLIYRVPASLQVITFSHYSRTLKREDVLACLLSAALDAISGASFSTPDTRVDEDSIMASSSRVHFIIHPDPRLTWAMLGTTVRGIKEWADRYEYLDCDFDIEMIGYPGMFGSGHLVYI